jgi:hypothetical protein
MSVRTVLSFLIWSTFSSFLLGIKGQTLDPTHSPSSLSTIPTEAPTECTATLPIQFSTSLILTASNEETLLVDEVGSLLEEAIRVSYNTEMENTFSLCQPLFREVQSATLVNEEGSASSLTFNIIGACEACEPGSDIFDVISKYSVLSSLVSYIESRSNAVVISGITEVDSIPCEDSLQDFSEDVLIELLVDCPEGLAPDLQAVANAFVSTYNDLAYCDPYFRFLVGAEVIEVGQIENNKTFPIVLRVAGVCDGCDPSTVSIYELPSSLSATTRRLVESRPAASFLENLVSGDRDIAHESGHKQQRDLQSLCYCDAQAIAERAPFESEFIEALQKSIQSMDIECVNSVRDCKFGSKFESYLVITLKGNETLAAAEAYLPLLEDAFKSALIRLFQPTEEECNPDFRIVESVSARFINLDEVRLRRKTQEDPPDSVPPTSAPSSSPTSTNPSLSPTLAPTPLLGGKSQSSSPTSTNPVLPPTLGPTISSNGNSPLISSLLTKTSGVCNGCSNDLFFGNALTRRRRELIYTDPFERILQQDGAATSSCYCPIDSEETTNPPESVVMVAYQEELDQRQVPLKVTDLQLVRVIPGENGGPDLVEPISPPPTAAPSSEPSSLPTQFPSEFPSPLPTQFPSEFPSSFPTQFPSDFPTSFPSESPQFPSESPIQPPTETPAILCGEYGEKCGTPGDCCSNRCVINQCRIAIETEGAKLVSCDVGGVAGERDCGGRGGAATGGGKRRVRGRKL